MHAANPRDVPNLVVHVPWCAVPSAGVALATLRERLRRRVTRLLDRLDEQWDNAPPVGGRWCGSCWLQHGWYVPTGTSASYPPTSRATG